MSKRNFGELESDIEVGLAQLHKKHAKVIHKCFKILSPYSLFNFYISQC